MKTTPDKYHLLKGSISVLINYSFSERYGWQHVFLDQNADLQYVKWLKVAAQNLLKWFEIDKMKTTSDKHHLLKGCISVFTKYSSSEL